MKTEPGFLLLLCGFIVIIAFIAFMLIPLISDLRARQVDLQILETRMRIFPEANISYYESRENLQILCRDEFFASLAYIRAAAYSHGLNVAAFIASEIDGFGMSVSETTVRATLTGSFSDAIDFVYYLVGGVYNVRYLSFVNAETTSFDIWLSIFHED